MYTFIVENVQEARILAAYYGMEIPTGQGRFPMRRLQNIASNAGDTIILSNYSNSAPLRDTTSYRVAALVKDGKFYRPTETTIDVDTVRQWAKKQARRGRTAHSDIVNAVINREGWQDATIITVEKE